jgi:phage gp36-like protein
MAYTTRDKIEAVIPGPLLIEALDDDRDGQEDDGAFDALVATASMAVDGYLAGRYTVPFPDPAPSIVQLAAFIFVCEIVYDRRELNGDKNPFGKRASDMRDLLKKIANQDMPLDAAQTSAFTRGAVVTDDVGLDSTLK